MCQQHEPADWDEGLARRALEGDGEGVREPRAVLCLRPRHQVEEPGLARRRGDVAAAAYGNLREIGRFRESALSLSAASERAKAEKSGAFSARTSFIKIMQFSFD